ncbi:MAG: DUF192 domain-containing protein [Gracilimonas sp.]|uniref:DUF192 domain-containing protein n=1 Tax=Gracilimonas TaxID=649462 RepID=UPI001B0C77EA|nr:DUF192 domain-containing protein [Gracilimonas sp.]MBO6586286.1 DUF192 domain-containing protein [Gracilimonas sp.]MBO6614943.1 DUF192 domain-containing protein [Gracilimonas sp.]
MKYSLSTLLFCTIFCSLFVLSCSQKDSNKKKEIPNQGRQLDLVEEVTFLTPEGEAISTVKVALADEPEERNQGLMDVTEMAPDAGMLFIFPNEAPRSFYMANTPLPLDIIFVNADSTIVRIHHNTTPFNSEQLPSEKPARFVVETNGGYCVSNDIQEGMRIRF